MKKINCIIIEDQAPAQRILQRYISQVERLNLLGTFTNAAQAAEFLAQNAVDLMFLDIHLPQVSGIDFLKSLDKRPCVIFTTAFPDYAVLSYEFSAVDYLVKPFSFSRFEMAISKIPNETASEVELVFKSGHEFIKLTCREILFVHSDMDYTEIHCADKMLLSSDTLAQWECKLKPHNFARVHKSYLVNLGRVARFNSLQLQLDNQASVPVGRAFRENINQLLRRS